MRIGLDARHAGTGLGIATVLRGLAGALHDRGVVEPVWIGADPPDGVEGAPPFPGPYPLGDGPVGRRHVRALGLDVVHFPGNTGWGRRGPVPSVLTVHDLIFFERLRGRSLRQRAGHAYMRRGVPRAIAAATVLTSGTRAIAAAVERSFGRRPVVIGHGVPFPMTTSAPADPPYLLAFGARDPRKGLDLALAVSEEAGVPLRVTSRAGLPEGFSGGRVTVLDDLDRTELDAAVAGALAIVYLSRDEGFGLPVLEAMAVGTPVVTGMAPATREVAGDAGLLVDPADPVRSGAAHVRAMMDRERRAAVVAAGREEARRRSWAAVAERYEAVYAEAGA